MNPKELDRLIQSICKQGEQFAFVVVVQGNPQKIFIRACGPSGRGIIGKIDKYVKSFPNFRESCGAKPNNKEAVVLLQFSNTIIPNRLSDFRRVWYKHWNRIAMISKGQGAYSPIDIARMLNDRSIQLQLRIDFDTLQIVDLKPSTGLKSALTSPVRLREAFDRVNAANSFRECWHLLR